MPQENIPKELSLSILPLIVKQATFKSIQNYSGTIYFDENETPLYFKSRNSQLYPSLFTLWKAPYILPVVVTNSYVIGVLANGADLMLPGCGVPFDHRIASGTVVGVAGSDAPSVIKAVGIAKMDLRNISKTVGTSGVAVEVLHHIDDKLCELNRFVDIKVPKSIEIVIPWEEESQKEEEVQEVEQEEEMVEEDEKEHQKQEQEQPQEEFKEVNDVSQELEELHVQDIDNFFVRALLQSIKLDTIQLPINASNFMASHVLKNLPILDSKYKNIKKTSWKKTGKFLKAMSKLNYISVKGKDDDLTITSTIPKSDKTIEEFITHKIEKLKKQDSGKDDKSSINLIQLYQPTNKYRMFFNKVGKEYDDLYTAPEIKALISDYIKKENLIDSNPQNIKLDGILGDIIPGGSVSRSELVVKFLKYFSMRYIVVQPGEDPNECKVQKGDLPKIDIVCETKIGRKTITRVKNFIPFGIKPNVISEDLRNLCQGSSTLEDTREGIEAIVQGPHYKSIHEYLIGKGVPAGCITYEDKSKKKKRR
ncbi:hypothetical protein PSN45_004943 [Yamadazyma tenuis]|uniref:uncharacterized protein n=1 Tax=Candida tenuis TaxID=2315449 RepID=UPI0027AB4EA1|nr:hypothetical protein PSN45_004943 [Yamadazyma tenuis]